MRLKSITVRNYRIHENVTVDLDESRTLIGGPNESGKSTLVEAAHRALFLKASVTGRAQRSMVSTVHDGHPEVEVRFVVGGETYHISKRFSGQSGTAKLTLEGGETWHQDEAEAELNRLLGVEDIGGGRGVAERAAGQWAHLWVRQGESGDDPSGHADSQRDTLLSRLQNEGGAVVLESELDARVAEKIAEKDAETHTAGGAVRAQSRLNHSIGTLDEAEQVAEEARQAAETLHQAVDELNQATRTIDEKQEALEKLGSSRKETQSKIREVEQLQHRRDLEKKDAEQAKIGHEAAIETDEEIMDLKEQIRSREKEIGPAEEKTQALTTKVARKKEFRDQAAEDKRQLDRDLRIARNRLDLARAWKELFESRAKESRLKKIAEEVLGLREESRSIESHLARLPAITDESFSTLQSLKQSLSQAEAGLDAMAAGIEVESAGQPVRVGEESLDAGQTRVIAEDTQVEIGDDTRLLIRPGGGTSLDEARAQVDRYRQALVQTLDELGIETVEEAAGIVEQRRELNAGLREKSAQLEGKDAESIEEDLAAATTAVEAAETEVQRRAGLLPEGADPLNPENSEDAIEQVAACQSDLDGQEEKETRIDAELSATREGFEAAEEELEAHRATIEESKSDLNRLQIRLQTFEETHGDAEKRKANLESLAADRKEAEGKLERTAKELAALQPESLEGNLERFERAIEQARLEIGEAEKKKAVAQNVLLRDGNQDPAETLALAEAELESARARHDSLKRKAEAIHLLAELFSEKRRELAHQFTGPLAERITGYLQTLFGPEARVEVEMSEQQFEKPVLVRGTRAFEFDDLSGGTREQVAAAFRLAMAEILAENHDGCLPVVFDDAFTNSDPDRIQTLQGMLDLAARRGLQVILLTCDPADYTALGATTVSLV